VFVALQSVRVYCIVVCFILLRSNIFIVIYSYRYAVIYNIEICLCLASPKSYIEFNTYTLIDLSSEVRRQPLNTTLWNVIGHERLFDEGAVEAATVAVLVEGGGAAASF
jgi:hypothetical protein